MRLSGTVFEVSTFRCCRGSASRAPRWLSLSTPCFPASRHSGPASAVLCQTEDF